MPSIDVLSLNPNFFSIYLMFLFCSQTPQDTIVYIYMLSSYAPCGCDSS